MLAILLLGASQPPATLGNPGFEAGDLSGWEVTLPRGYDAAADTDRPYAGLFSAFIAYQARNRADREEASLGTRVAAQAYRGRRIRVSAMLRLEAAGAARLEVAAGATIARASSAGDRWRRTSVELAVPADADAISILIAISPGNDVQVDDVRIDAL